MTKISFLICFIVMCSFFFCLKLNWNVRMIVLGTILVSTFHVIDRSYIENYNRLSKAIAKIQRGQQGILHRMIVMY